MGLHLTVPIIALNFLSELPLQALQLFFCARAGFNDVLHIQTPKPVRKLIAAVRFPSVFPIQIIQHVLALGFILSCFPPHVKGQHFVSIHMMDTISG